jgi:7-cyano-7-deazaguanine synthase
MGVDGRNLVAVEVLLLSGGLESTALAAWRRPPLALTIDYGQAPATGEITAAAAVCRVLALKHHVFRVDCSRVGSGLLAPAASAVHAPTVEWWPYRNQLLVTLAAGWGAQNDVTSITVGSVIGDGERHADGTADFYEKLDALLAMQEGAVRVNAPAAGMTSEELIVASGVTDAVLGWTHSCHTGDLSCGTCPGCVKHQGVLERLGRLQ